ncbi:DUF116 domain-containing protein [Desulfovibrio sp. OttesenSCG-928-A18]|nr:DUF116 domain-containing protein [Desulfovibrio sp. OttesenSCG-928-A18]
MDKGIALDQKRRFLEFMSEQTARKPRKRLFIGLVTGTSVLLCLLLLVGWVIPLVGLGNIHPSIPYITGSLLLTCILVIAWASLVLVLQIITGRAFWGSRRVRGIAIKFFLPIMELLARPFGFSKGEVRRSFIKVNNELTLSQHGPVPPERVLILLPHCLQRTDCPIRLTTRIDACERCGRCPMAGLLSLRDKYGARLAVATGGTIARKIVVETRPHLIIAIACERDLASGIQDTHPLPVFGILNSRPQGPCCDTQVALALVDDALSRFCAGSAQIPGRQSSSAPLQSTPGA